MNEIAEISEADLALVGALEVNPRAEWSVLGATLGLAPSTVSRRWAALTERGDAWVTLAPGPRYLEAGSSAFLFLSTEPERQDVVLEALCASPFFGTVSRMTGEYDVMADCFAPGYEQLMDAVSAVLSGLSGVTRWEVVLATRLHREGTQWRLGTIDPGQERALGIGAPDRKAGRLGAVDAALVAALSRDGRAGWERLGAQVGVSAQTARRRTEQLLSGGQVSLRCDFSTAFRPRHREVTIILSVPAAQLEPAGRFFAEQASCRVSAQVLGRCNLLATFWVRDLLEVHALELRVLQQIPGATVLGRQAVVRTDKRSGHRLDRAGRSTGVVPLLLGGEDPGTVQGSPVL
ncbi:AsnC family transcriptional regulator [Arthrobacter sp. NPDC090010]|uniref:AsnC family transcriptional regulator n=1 Tax=Arthrobacter sp. NPDC090010 TaxID=3363942 RepID=UPI003825B9F7